MKGRQEREGAKDGWEGKEQRQKLRKDGREKRRGGEITDGKILQGSIYTRYFKSVKLIETEKRIWLPRTGVGYGARRK